MCPSVLSRDVATLGAPKAAQEMVGELQIQATPASSAFTPPMRKGVTFTGSPVLVSPFQPKFDRQSFEKHLQDLQVSLFIT